MSADMSKEARRDKFLREHPGHPSLRTDRYRSTYHPRGRRRWMYREIMAFLDLAERELSKGNDQWKAMIREEVAQLRTKLADIMTAGKFKRL